MKFIRWPCLFLSCLLFSPWDLVAQTDTSRSVEYFPQQRLFPKFLADGTAQQSSLNKDLRTRRWIGGIGGPLRILRLTTGSFTLQTGIGATVYATLIRQPHILEVMTVDFFVDIPVEIQWSENFVLRTGWGHYSAHLADDGIEIVGLSPINYAKDYIPVFGAYTIPSMGGFIYSGVRIDYYTIPENGKNWVLQFGAEGGNVAVASGIRLYGAIDIKLKSEVAWGSTQSYQIGVKMLERYAQAIRLAYTYRTGFDDRGQFYKTKADISLLGLFFDF